MRSACPAASPRPWSSRVDCRRTAATTAYYQGRNFLKKAGTVIVGLCMVMWWLSAYPHAEPPPRSLELRTEADRLETSAAE
ncbi:MAG: hypothetical protein HC897_00120, partial [Thermoanaerobaculia bacterium]|nr:hypothetical protein [Thermoanaerobaculia bacterium]